ncbi:hypothetical protein AB0N65_11600 [Paenarthrobacter sp. NPDC089322]|uniref:DUF3885 domain-containing protein n=1 Tax=Paenarthrobacter sp. NPDC089322 TaxID=3155065 RepID=UPI00342D8430
MTDENKKSETMLLRVRKLFFSGNLRGYSVKWIFISSWRRLRRQGGNSKHAENSPRAKELTNQWESAWPGCEPSGSSLRDNKPGLWVRMHSLPQDKRYADDSEERREVLHRHQTLLNDLLAISSSTRIRVIGQDYDTNDNYSGWTKKHMPGSWPWRVHFDTDLHDDVSGGRVPGTYFWVSPYDTVGQLTGLLEQAAEDVAKFIVTDLSMTWVYAPYDGGADIIAPTPEAREALETAHSEWLPNETGIV